MSAQAIPPNLHPLIIEKAGEGWPSRRIAEWLRTEYSVQCSHASVARIMAVSRKERADIAKTVVREKLAPSLTRDVDRLERLVNRTLARIRKGPGDEMFVKLAEQARKLIDTKMHYSGADEQVGHIELDLSGMSDDELERLAAEAEASATGSNRNRAARKAKA